MSRAKYGIYRTRKEKGEHTVELLEGPMPRLQAVKRAKELQRRSVLAFGYSGSGPLPDGFETFWAIHTESGNIAF